MWNKPLRSRRCQAGFTVIEVMVAVTLLTVGILSALRVAHAVGQASDRNEHQVVATNLAREGIEYVRNVRDSNWQTYFYAQRHDLAAGHATPVAAAGLRWDAYCPDAHSSCTNLFRNAPGNHVLHIPRAGDRSPYFTPGGAINSPQDYANRPEYLVCPVAAWPNGPSWDVANPSECHGQAYYRRIVITPQPGKAATTSGSCQDTSNGNNSEPTLKVESRVSWRKPNGRLEPEVVLETYLTDWRRCTDILPPPPAGDPGAGGPPTSWTGDANGPGAYSCAGVDCRRLTGAQSGSAYSWSAPATHTYSVPSLAAGDYRLHINYQNRNGTGDSANTPPHFQYQVDVLVNGVEWISNLRLNAGDGTQPLSHYALLTGLPAGPFTIALRWDGGNDHYDPGRGWDSNFQVNSLTLQSKSGLDQAGQANGFLSAQIDWQERAGQSSNCRNVWLDSGPGGRITLSPGTVPPFNTAGRVTEQQVAPATYTVSGTANPPGQNNPVCEVSPGSLLIQPYTTTPLMMVIGR